MFVLFFVCLFIGTILYNNVHSKVKILMCWWPMLFLFYIYFIEPLKVVLCTWIIGAAVKHLEIYISGIDIRPFSYTNNTFGWTLQKVRARETFIFATIMSAQTLTSFEPVPAKLTYKSGRESLNHEDISQFWGFWLSRRRTIFEIKNKSSDLWMNLDGSSALVSVPQQRTHSVNLCTGGLYWCYHTSNNF